MRPDLRKKLKTALIVLCVCTVLFIWYNSAQSREESAGLSNSLLQTLADMLRQFGIIIDATDDFLLRKLAHFAEFGLLGTELALIMLVEEKVSVQGAVNCLFAGLLTALTDETIQIFSNRGSQVKDVLLDFSGVLTAVLLVVLIYKAAETKKRRM